MYAFTSLAVNIIVSEIPDPGRRSRPGFCDIKLVWKTADVVFECYRSERILDMDLEDKYWYIWG